MSSRTKRNKIILDSDDEEEMIKNEQQAQMVTNAKQEDRIEYEEEEEIENEEQEKMEEKDISGNIFHYLTGETEYDKNRKQYYFILTSGEKLFFDEYISLFDQSFDSTFKELFLNSPKILQDFLNNVYLENNDMKISNLEFLVGDYYDIGKQHNFNSLSSDIACRADIETKETILIDVEIQIGWREIMDDRLFEYGSLLRNRYSNQEREKQKEKDIENKKIERLYKDTIVIAFILDKDLKKGNLSCLINLNKQKNNEKTLIPMKNFQIVEIHLFYEVEKIITGNFKTLFGSTLSEDGQDWLKLIGLRCWAKKSKEKIKYLLPKLSGNQKYSKNKNINDAIITLINGTRKMYQLYDEIDVMYMECLKMVKEEYKIKDIKKIYSLFIEKMDPLKILKLDYKVREEEIIEILEEFKKEKPITSLQVSNFINYLKKYNYIIK